MMKLSSAVLYCLYSQHTFRVPTDIEVGGITEVRKSHGILLVVRERVQVSSE